MSNTTENFNMSNIFNISNENYYKMTKKDFRNNYKNFYENQYNRYRNISYRFINNKIIKK